MNQKVQTTAVTENPPTTDSPVPHGADRLALPGEQCLCGLPAKVVYLTPGYGNIGFCGRHG